MDPGRAARLTAVACLLLVAGLTGCSNGDEGAAPGTARSGASAPGDRTRLHVVTTVAPLTSIVATIAGSAATVSGLVPEGVDSHTFEPAPSVARELARADVVFLNGLGLEDPTEDLAEANLADDALLVKLGDEVLPEDDWIFDRSFPEAGGRPNPHLWTDPTLARRYASTVHRTLVRLDPSNASAYDANHTALAERIDALDRAVAEASRSIAAEKRTLVTYHDAYAYFARTYGWTVVGAVQPADFLEPSAREVATLIEQIRRREVPVVFGSEVFPSEVLEEISAETGATYVDDLRDDDLPGEPGDAEHSWLGLMRFNYTTMVEAFGGDATELRSLDLPDVAADGAHYPQ